MPRDTKESKDPSKSRKNTSKTARVLGLLTTPSIDESATVEAPAAPPVNKEQFLEDTIRDALEQELNAEPAPAPARRPSRRSRRETASTDFTPQAFDAPAPTDFTPPAFDAPANFTPPAFDAPEAPQSDSQAEQLTEERMAHYEAEFEAIEPMQPEQAPPQPEEPEPHYRLMQWPVEPAAIQPIRPFRPEAAAAADGPQPEEPQSTEASELVAEDECYNVMQALVEAKMDKFMKMFGLCSCSRCRADVTALALTHLPPKYVVAKYHNLVPLLPLYEGKYDADVTAEVIQACKLVLAHPRHNK